MFTELSSVRVSSRAYRPIEGGKRACNCCTSCIEEEMLKVTIFKSKSDIDHALLHKVIIHTASFGDLNLITASILPSIQDVREFHALSPP